MHRVLQRYSLRYLCYLLLGSCIACSSNNSINSNYQADGGITLVPGDMEQVEFVDTDILGVYDGIVLLYDNFDNEFIYFRNDKKILQSSLSDSHAAIRAASKHSKQQRNNFHLLKNNASRFMRTSDTSGKVLLNEDGLALNVSSVSGGQLMTAFLLERNTQGIWIQQEELLTSEGRYMGEATYPLQPVAAVRFYDLQGEFLSQKSVVLNKPRKTLSYFKVSESGDLFFLSYNHSSRKMEPTLLQLDEFSRLAATVPGVDTSQLPLSAASQSDLLELTSFEALVREQEPSASFQTAITSADDIMDRATRILETSWRLNKNNFAEDKDASCLKPSSIWRRPTKLDAELVGSEISGPPYKWGGNQSLSKFSARISDGAIAGDVCTCRCDKGASCRAEDWCIEPHTAGFDCSGFVSNAWGIPYHSTVTLYKVGRPIKWDSLQAGDILNHPGKHVRLFAGIVGEDTKNFKIMESSVGCSGVCERVLNASELAGYIPYRLKTIEN